MYIGKSNLKVILLLVIAFCLLSPHASCQSAGSFKADTLIELYVPDTCQVTITVHNVLGETLGIAFDMITQGKISIPLKNLVLTSVLYVDSLPPETTYVQYNSLTPGVYYYKAMIGDKKITKKLTLLK